jgi:single-strand DNA-binding protein
MAGQLRFPKINNVVISGRLAQDVEIKHSASNHTIARVVIAVNRTHKNEQGEFEEEVSFIDCIAFGETAKKCIKDLKKGSPVILEGYLQARAYEDRNGQKRKATEIVLNKAYPLEKTGENLDYYASQHSDNSYQSAPPRHNPTNNTDYAQKSDNFQTYDNMPPNVTTEDDVPF